MLSACAPKMWEQFSSCWVSPLADVGMHSLYSIHHLRLVPRESASPQMGQMTEGPSPKLVLHLLSTEHGGLGLSKQLQKNAGRVWVGLLQNLLSQLDICFESARGSIEPCMGMRCGVQVGCHLRTLLRVRGHELHPRLPLKWLPVYCIGTHVFSKTSVVPGHIASHKTGILGVATF